MSNVPYNDPMRDEMADLETSMEFSHERGGLFYERPENFMDSWAREASSSMVARTGGAFAFVEWEPPSRFGEAVTGGHFALAGLVTDEAVGVVA